MSVCVKLTSDWGATKQTSSIMWGLDARYLQVIVAADEEQRATPGFRPDEGKAKDGPEVREVSSLPSSYSYRLKVSIAAIPLL